jgi:hypothetical protein
MEVLRFPTRWAVLHLSDVHRKPLLAHEVGNQLSPTDTIKPHSDGFALMAAALGVILGIAFGLLGDSSSLLFGALLLWSALLVALAQQALP